MAYGETQPKTLKDIYQERKKTGQNPSLQVSQATSTIGIDQPPPVGTASQYPKIAEPSKAKEFSLHKGYPNGVPSGAARMVPSWDYDGNTGKFLVGEAKEMKRRSLWDRYRQIQRRRGTRASSFVKQVANRPTVNSMKYGA